MRPAATSTEQQIWWLLFGAFAITGAFIAALHFAQGVQWAVAGLAILALGLAMGFIGRRVTLTNRRLLQRLVAAEERFHALVDNAAEAVIETDTGQRIRYANPACHTILEKPPDALLGEAFNLESLQTLAPGIESRHSTYEHQDERRTIFVLRDVSERLRSTEEGVRLNRHVNVLRNQEGLASLAAGLAHGFNNELAVIVANAEMLQLEATGEAQEAGQDLLRACDRMGEQIRSLRACCSQRPVELKPVDLNDLVRQSASCPTVEGVTLSVELTDQPLMVLGDERELGQVVSNLIQNALEAVGNGPGQITMTTRQQPGTGDLSQEAGGAAVLEVADDGVGLQRGNPAQLFHPFFSTKGSHLGLGLTVAYGTVVAHGGLLRAVPRDDRGMVLEAKLPLAPRT